LCPLQKIYIEKVTIEVLFEVASSKGNLVLLIIYIITFNFVMQMLLCKVRLAIQKPIKIIFLNWWFDNFRS